MDALSPRESFYSRFRNPLVLIAIVLAQTIALAVQVQRPGDESSAARADVGKTMLLRRWIITIVTPFEKLSHGTGMNARNVWSSYIGLRHAHEDNLALQQQVARLRQEEAAFAEDAAQGRRLQALLGFKEQYITKTVAAQVIGTSGSDRSHTLWLDKGSNDGLKPDQAVITPDGVVGKLRDVLPSTSQLLLLSDPSSGAGVVLESTRIRGILRGTVNGDIEINNLTTDDRIKPGEKVLTSGGDKVFPRGLPIGIVESIRPDPQHQPYTAIKIKPAANLSRLEEVLVITETDSKLSDVAKQDADSAEVIAQENKRAADLVSEKLPGLHDNSSRSDKPAEDNADQPSSMADPDKQPPMKIRQPLHTDRYSPGSAPPAENLKPGGKTSEQP